MKIFVQARPGAGQELVEDLGRDNFRVWVRESPERGLANKALIRALAEYFSVTQSQVKIIRGFTSRNKIVQIIK